MKEAPSQRQMTDPSNAQPGKPNYIDKTAETPGNPFNSKEGDMDAPNYVASNPRYWEHR